MIANGTTRNRYWQSFPYNNNNNNNGVTSVARKSLKTMPRGASMLIDLIVNKQFQLSSD